MDIKKVIAEAKPEECKLALENFLENFLSPAFGSMPKGEIEMEILNILTVIEVVGRKPTEYELVSKLRITKTKARQLIYNRELRTRTSSELDTEVREILLNPVIQKRGELFALQVTSPLVLDHLRAKVRELGHLTDGSFSTNIVTLNLDAMAALIESNLDQQQKEAAKNALIGAGAPNSTLLGVLKATLKKFGKKIADDTGEDVVEKVSEYMKPILDGAFESAQDLFGNLFKEKNYK